MEKQKTYNAINASAGSGKTYALVQRILMLCLAWPEQHDAIRHILALTFTNKAANEMKERILSWLKAFTQEDYRNNLELENIRKELGERGIKATAQDLHLRAQKVLDYILHHYSMLNIGTIDKFNSRLVRSFSYELGLAHQFNLEIKSEPYLMEAVDKMLEQIGQDGQTSEAFMDFVNYNLENDERMNLNTALYKKAQEFVSDVHYHALKDNENFDWEAYGQLKKELREQIRNHRSKVRELAESSLKLIKDNGLENGDFFGGGNKSLQYFFDNVVKNGSPKLLESPEEEEKKIQNYRKGASKAGKAKEAQIFSILDVLLDNRHEIISNHIAAEKKNKILRELLPLKFNREIQEKLQEIETENDLVLLSKFNVLINENLKHEPSAFIYEKVGTQFQHFFFDEFQDTSRMQWENILPLRDHSITSSGHSFTLVGDPKQSIYRFRGGDSDLMLDILNSREKTPVKVEVETLANNWRSAKNIVQFNNDLYKYIAKSLNPDHRILFSDKAEQIPKRAIAGRVKVSLTDYEKNKNFYFNNVTEQMHRDVQDCLNRGFKFSDITILCRWASEIKKFSQLLGMKKVNAEGIETNIKTISEKGLTLSLSYTLQAVSYFLKWEIQPENRQYLTRMVYALYKLGRIEIQDFTEAMTEMLAIPKKSDLEAFIAEKYHVRLQQTDFPKLNLYNYIEYYVHEFSVAGKETDFLLNFLENTYNFTQNAGLTVKDFVKFWDEEGASSAIQASENIDAINLMTIHAAKGLEFPVVFFPSMNSHKDGAFSDWLPVQGYSELKSVHTEGFSNEFATYDPDIESFNEENTYRNKIDRLCVQYVATTRPVEQLFLYLEKPSKKGSKSELYDFIEQHNPANLEEFDLYPETDHSFQRKTGQPKVPHTTLPLNKLCHGHESVKNIKIATPSRQYQTAVASVRTGIFTHEILAKIKIPGDIAKVLESYLLKGEISKEEKVSIQERINKVVTAPENISYFAENLKIINEKEILMNLNGVIEICRPDRLIETADGFIIIDFKTGAPHPKHQEQLDAYATILQQVGKNVLEKKIIYI